MIRFVAFILTLALCAAGIARADQASDSLLNADRALSALSQKIGFVPAFSQAMGPNPRKFDSGSPTAIGQAQALRMLAFATSTYGDGGLMESGAGSPTSEPNKGEKRTRVAG